MRISRWILAPSASSTEFAHTNTLPSSWSRVSVQVLDLHLAAHIRAMHPSLRREQAALAAPLRCARCTALFGAKPAALALCVAFAAGSRCVRRSRPAAKPLNSRGLQTALDANTAALALVAFARSGAPCDFSTPAPSEPCSAPQPVGAVGHQIIVFGGGARI